MPMNRGSGSVPAPGSMECDEVDDDDDAVDG